MKARELGVYWVVREVLSEATNLITITWDLMQYCPLYDSQGNELEVFRWFSIGHDWQKVSYVDSDFTYIGPKIESPTHLQEMYKKLRSIEHSER